MQIKKHIGKLINTDKRIAVVYMQIPDKESHALVVDLDALPDSISTDVNNIINGAGQNQHNLGDQFAKTFIGHLGNNLLTILHKSNRLFSTPVDNIMMYPLPNNPVKLSQVIEEINKLTTNNPVSTNYNISDNTKLFNQNIEQNLPEDSTSDNAKNLLIQAELLIEDADKLKQKAYELDPTLKPKTNKKVPTKKDDKLISE